MEITIDNVNKVMIRAGKMNTALRTRVQSGAHRNAAGEERGFDVGRWNMELWRHNVIKVEGPLFAGVPVPLTYTALENLPTELDELMDKALLEIFRINYGPDSDADPNPPTPTETTQSTDAGS